MTISQPEEVDAGLQGYWDNHEVSFTDCRLYEGENIYYFNAGKLTYESATRTNRRSSNYTYFGPYTEPIPSINEVLLQTLKTVRIFYAVLI